MTISRAAIGSGAFFLLAPGVMSGLVPWLLTGWEARDAGAATIPLRVAGVAAIAAGLAVVLAAFARFVSEGAGTPAPVAPTERLVVGGLYRHVRNPMYVAVTSIIAGQALALAQPVLAVYAALFLAVTAAFVRLHEEPALSRRYGEQYEAYRRAVPGWRPRVRPWRGGS
jgi:protein-S-isoprenylcysteine O-methyltransferase Ste14